MQMLDYVGLTIHIRGGQSVDRCKKVRKYGERGFLEVLNVPLFLRAANPESRILFPAGLNSILWHGVRSNFEVLLYIRNSPFLYYSIIQLELVGLVISIREGMRL